MCGFRFAVSIVSLVSLLICGSAALAGDDNAKEDARVFRVDFAASNGVESPRIGFLGGLRDETPDTLIEPLHPKLWRIGHQFRGRIKAGLPAAIGRVQSLGATYKLVMSDLINSTPTDFDKYEADVKKLVSQTGDDAAKIIWEPVNEPDTSFKPIDKYYAIYAHAFRPLRRHAPLPAFAGPALHFPATISTKRFSNIAGKIILSVTTFPTTTPAGILTRRSNKNGI